MKMKLSFLVKNIKRFNINVKKFYHGKYLRAWTSFLFCVMRFGCSFDDYFRYEFYKKSNYERDKFITYRRSKKIIRKYNKSKDKSIFYDKQKFNEYFSDYIKREYLSLENASQEQFVDFCLKHNGGIMKPRRGGQGIGIFKISVSDINRYHIDDYRGYIIEEILVQHSELDLLNSSSVNTIRVLTFKKKIVACAIRVGVKNAPVDNLHSNGVCGCIDINTGCVIAPFINNQLEKYLYHPTNGSRLIGFQVPNWELVKQEVYKASNLLPEVGYVGWDVAILENNVALIEGNHDPGHDVVQMIAQTGIYELIRKIEKQQK